MLLRRVARPLLAAIFVSGGVNEFRNPAAHADVVKPLLDKGQDALPNSTDNTTLVQVDAAVKVGAGALLALGWMPRLAATALAASLIPTTVGAHAFWEIKDDDERSAQQIHFFKNAGLLGGLMLAAADTGGKPSLGYRARRAGRKAEKKAEKKAGRAQQRARKHASATLEGAASRSGRGRTRR
ncbi:MAG: DoxX family membrane protein [Pseudonocardiaceae bacterium]|nr:DoxX family membrane protein [Pseudonocardiaceae bacterium]